MINMRRGLLILFLLGLSLINPVMAKNSVKEESGNTKYTFEQDNMGDPILPSIFIWEIPENNTANDNKEESLNEDLYAQDYDEYNEEEITLSQDNSTVKGYLEYAEGADAIYLKDDHKEFVLNLQVPQKFGTSRAADNSKLPKTTFANNVYARSGDIAYNIAPVDANAVIAKKGNFSFGTAYNESIDKSDLGFTTSFYTKYDQKYFSLSSSYNKESGVAYSMVVDKFSVTPELKLNQYISIKDVMTSDITRNRKQNSLILSIKPTRDDRLRFEFGAGQTFDESREMIKSEVKFSTQFRW